MEKKKLFIRQATPVEILKKRDISSLPNRASRYKKLLPFRNIPQVTTLRVFDHMEEAEMSFINGCYRSCIICSSNAVEQSFIHELIKCSEDWERTYWEIEIKQMNFFNIIKESKKNQSLEKFANDADWLRRVRNKIVAHPTYIAGLTEFDKTEKIIWSNKIMLRDLKQLLNFLPKTKRIKLENEKITETKSDGTIIQESESLKSLLADPIKIEQIYLLDWWVFQKGLLNELALEAYGKASNILKGISPVEKSNNF